MSTVNNIESPKRSDRIFPKYALICAIWLFLVGGSYVWNAQELKQDVLRTSTAVARTVLEKDIAFRNWASSHGGVYVPPTAAVPPNPYLKVPDRDVVTTTGKVLTLMNPAYVMRDVQQGYDKTSGIKSHLTSLKLLNPDNAPDDWERNALLGFDKGNKEELKVSEIDGQPYLRLMQPFVVTEGCLKCHGEQGYKVGDIRGGIGAYVPMRPFLDDELAHKEEIVLWHGLIFLAGLLSILAAFRHEQSTSEMLRADLTRAKKAEESLERSQRLLAESEEVGKVGGWEVDVDTGKLTWTKEVYLIHEVDADYDLNVGKGINFYTPASRPIIEQAMRRAMEQGEPFDVELEITTAKGNLRNVRAMGKADLENRRVHGFFQDITEKKTSEAMLLQSEEQYRSLFENNHSNILIISPEDGAIVDVNPAAAAYYGWTIDELKHKNIAEINTLTPDQIKAELKLAREEKRNHFVFKHRRAQGEPRDVEVYSTPVVIRGRLLLYSVVFDITDRKLAELQIVEQNKELQRWYDVTQGRETRVIELKHEVNELLKQAGQPERYPSAEES